MQVGVLGYKCAVALFCLACGDEKLASDMGERVSGWGWWMGDTHLDSRSDDLVWVGCDQREEFAGSGSDYVRSVGLHGEQKKRVSW